MLQYNNSKTKMEGPKESLAQLFGAVERDTSRIVEDRYLANCFPCHVMKAQSKFALIV